MWVSVNLIRADFFPRFEANCLSGRNSHFFTRSGIATNAALARLYDKDPETAQLNPLSALQRTLERLEDRFHRNFRFNLCDV
jgi:hypothetical protein